MKCKMKQCTKEAKYPRLELCQVHYMLQWRGKTEPGFERKICEHCGQEYKPKASNQQYCNDPECRRWNRNRINRRNRKQSVKLIVCEVCGHMFETSRWKFQRCCGSECQKLLGKISKAKYYQEVVKQKKGHLDRGQSYPQRYIFDLVQKNFSSLSWKYDDRSTLKNPETGYPLELDIWCPEKRVAIEYDGEHHFSGKPYGQEVFDYVRHLDAIKTQLCVESDIALLRISCRDDWRDEKWIIQKMMEFCQ